MESISQNCKEYSKDDENNRHDLILLLEISHRPVTDILGNLFHSHRPFAFLHHLPEKMPGEKKGEQRRCRDNVE